MYVYSTPINLHKKLNYHIYILLCYIYQVCPGYLSPSLCYFLFVCVCSNVVYVYSIVVRSTQVPHTSQHVNYRDLCRRFSFSCQKVYQFIPFRENEITDGLCLSTPTRMTFLGQIRRDIVISYFSFGCL